MKLRKLIQPDEKFVMDATRETTVKDVDSVMTQEGLLRRVFKGFKFISRYAKMSDILMMLLKDWRKGNYTQLPYFTIAAITAAFIYVLSPLDLVPDFIPGLGYIDDATVLTIVIGWIDTDLHKYLDWKLSSEESSHNMDMEDAAGNHGAIEEEASGE